MCRAGPEYVCRCGMRASVCFLSGSGCLTSPCWAGPGPLEGSWPRRKGCELRAALPLNSPPSEGALLVCASGSACGCSHHFAFLALRLHQRLGRCCPRAVLPRVLPLGCGPAAFLTAWVSASCHQARPCSHRSPRCPSLLCCPSCERRRRRGWSPGWSAEGQTLVLCHVDKTKASGQTPEGPGVEDAWTVLALDSEEMSVTGLEGHLDRPHLFSSLGGGGRAHCCLSCVTELFKEGVGPGGWTGQRCPQRPVFPSCSVSGLCLRLHNKVV